MTSGVYAITNTADGTTYVGSSIDIETRWIAHRHTFTGDGYEWTILEETTPTPDALEAAEQRWMDCYMDRLCNVRKTARRQRPNPLYLDLHGLRLQERREALGLSIPALARRFRCTITNVYRWETGKSEPNKLKRIGAEVVLKQLERNRSPRRRAQRSGDAP